METRVNTKNRKIETTRVHSTESCGLEAGVGCLHRSYVAWYGTGRHVRY